MSESCPYYLPPCPCNLNTDARGKCMLKEHYLNGKYNLDDCYMLDHRYCSLFCKHTNLEDIENETTATGKPKNEIAYRISQSY